MPISFQCECGRTFRTADENAGRSAKCPQCGVQLLVPATDGGRPLRDGPPPVPDEEAPAAEGRGYNLASEEVVPVPRRAGASAPYDRPRGDNRDDDYPQRQSSRPRYDDPNRFVKRPPARHAGGMTDRGAIAGMLMMVGAVVWFVVGMAVGIIFFYPPILFIIGLICFIKGLANRG